MATNDRENEIQRRGAYHELFSSPLGQEVLEDLKEVFGYYLNNSHVILNSPNASVASTYILATKDMIAHIEHSMRPLHEDELEASYSNQLEGEVYE